MHPTDPAAAQAAPPGGVPAISPASPPAVLMLAAGRGRRLAGAGGDAEAEPKILLRFGGRSLLQRHLERLDRAGAGPVTLVVGFRGALIEAELRRLGRLDRVSLIHNPDWHQGSIVSLAAGARVLRSNRPVLLMDADVIYGQALIDRLLRSRHPAALLLDRALEPGDEPVKICVDAAGRMVDFAKRPAAAHDWHGESVGFFLFRPPLAAALADRAEAMIGEAGPMVEYEEPIRAMIRADALAASEPSFGFEDITGLPWTEIDFVEDVARAEALVPQVSEHLA